MGAALASVSGERAPSAGSADTAIQLGAHEPRSALSFPCSVATPCCARPRRREAETTLTSEAATYEAAVRRHGQHFTGAAARRHRDSATQPGVPPARATSKVRRDKLTSPLAGYQAGGNPASAHPLTTRQAGAPGLSSGRRASGVAPLPMPTTNRTGGAPGNAPGQSRGMR